MAHLKFFKYSDKQTKIHELDGRVKLLLLIIFSFIIGRIDGAVQFALVAFALAVLCAVAKISIIKIVKEIALILILIALLVIFGNVVLAVRLLLMLLITQIFITTTVPQTIHYTIWWYLKPVPFVPEVKIAMIINLTFIFIPLILATYSTICDAHKSRGLHMRKNPIRALKYTVTPLLFSVINQMNDLILAMEARNYSEDRPLPDFCATTLDVIALLTALAFATILFFI